MDTKPVIVFDKPWGKKSWLVKYDGPYNNTRPAHVEVGEINMGKYKPGFKFTLSNLHTSGGAVMWDVDRLKNEKGQRAHFTVYYGSDPQGQLPKFLASQCDSCGEWNPKSQCGGMNCGLLYCNQQCADNHWELGHKH